MATTKIQRQPSPQVQTKINDLRRERNAAIRTRDEARKAGDFGKAASASMTALFLQTSIESLQEGK